MKFKLLAGLVLSMSFAASANAGKIFEWNDPVQGNYPPECSATQSYGTGGGGYGYSYLYNEYLVQCPGHTVTVTRLLETNGNHQNCTMGTRDSNYYTSFNNCDNWRVYEK
ncbi:hypothetical protein [Teredinibacter haidensis]|uniref:hypothetical protein n=1 Tax=Teredinibacter haidensis TaxID=2731755 RepID=UPI0009490946|nr:hypothetical protein [Teredinibacter haidensis]